MFRVTYFKYSTSNVNPLHGLKAFKLKLDHVQDHIFQILYIHSNKFVQGQMYHVQGQLCHVQGLYMYACPGSHNNYVIFMDTYNVQGHIIYILSRYTYHIHSQISCPGSCRYMLLV